jgi:hypothetical protein
MVTLMQWVVWTQQHSVAVVTAVFSVILITTFWPGSRSTLERHGHIPLDDDA